jgi:predicted protein tyrosine phosphatase
MTIIVSPLSQIRELILARRPSHLITLLDPEVLIDTPEGVEPDRHLRLAVYDVNEAVEHMTPPQERHVHQILEFARSWDERAPLLVHCWAGISRSTATAYMLACERNPHASEHDIAHRLRSAAPHALPNRRLVQLADEMLGREGRMIAAVEAIGGNGFVPMGRAFDLPTRY